MNKNDENLLAGIEYLGVSGVTAPCKKSVMRFLQYRDEITHAKILSSGNSHCLLLTVNGRFVAIKSGFSSGYMGEGPSALSYIIQLLQVYEVELDEYKVDETFIERLDNSSLTVNDIEYLETSDPIQPVRLYEYVFVEDLKLERDGAIWYQFRPVIPLAIIDRRIVDLAMNFWNHPDESLTTGYRRLEDLVRKIIESKEHGTKLFAEAFQDQKAKLGWKDMESGEQKGRANLFIAVYMAYRNPRAHRELNQNSKDQLSEFLLLNHLYILEKEAFDIKTEERKNK